ncbi:uncharacterized protein L203_101597 [Cryptococcus depauperatus CBS 7841]|uniref:Peptidase M48 domain-containing protein n=1 Tax=Cryptococcus depauperatus CBS 7841 TaxID=1295531 RepID=A0AAJ8JQ90_9TREE
MPALKSGLLNITRISLLVFPFAIRYKVWKRYRRISMVVLQIPVFFACLVLAYGLDQSPRTGRWRLLLMGDLEELAWARRKHQQVLHNDGDHLLPPDDPRSIQITRVTSKLIQALEKEDRHVVCGASWPPRSQELARVMSEREALALEHGKQFEPSGVASSTHIPYRLPSDNPFILPLIEEADWRLYVIDSPEVNAFALPSRDVFVYTGLLKTLPGDDTMLAAVLSHEIAHVAQRHSVENMGFLNLVTVAFDVFRGFSYAFAISFPLLTVSVNFAINYLNNVITERAYSRKLEIEADAVGLQIMAAAGYDPRGAEDLWELMMCVEQDVALAGHPVGMENRFTLLRTHPTSAARRLALEEDMETALKVWREHA